jgi:hypothetical protein
VPSRRAFVIKAEVTDLRAETFFFREQKTMYGGEADHVAAFLRGFF